MENQEFRGILLKLQDRLSDEDRKRLHFFFGNDVPRRIRDDPSLSGTLNLLESLFDQDKINENDCTLLIKAFNEIRCYDAANLLQSHIKQMKHADQLESIERLSSIMPTTPDQLFQDQEVEDKFNIKHNFNHSECNGDIQTNFVKSNNTNINPFTLVLNTQSSQETILKPQIKPKKISKTYIILIMFCVLSLIGLATFAGAYIYERSIVKHLKDTIEMKDRTVLQEQRKNNEMIRNYTKLEEQLRDYQEHGKNSIIFPGKKYGGSDGEIFDDSTIKGFTCSHFIRGILGRRNFYPSDWFQFLYSSSSSPEEIIEGGIHGTRLENDGAERFVLSNDERVSKVEVVYEYVPNYKRIATNMTLAIRGIRLFTTQNRSSVELNHIVGERSFEHYDGYTVAYVAGRSEAHINQIQFYWVRNT